jgi:hypothetical protein
MKLMKIEIFVRDILLITQPYKMRIGFSGFSTTLTEYILTNVQEYDIEIMAEEVIGVFHQGLFRQDVSFRMSPVANDVLVRIFNRDHTVTEREKQELVDFLTILGSNTPRRFVELIEFDTLNTINARYESVYNLRHEQPIDEYLEFLDRECMRIEESLMLSREPSSTEYYHLDYEEYQDNEETRSRFVLVYHE